MSQTEYMKLMKPNHGLCHCALTCAEQPAPDHRPADLKSDPKPKALRDMNQFWTSPGPRSCLEGFVVTQKLQDISTDVVPNVFLAMNRDSAGKSEHQLPRINDCCWSWTRACLRQVPGGLVPLTSSRSKLQVHEH